MKLVAVSGHAFVTTKEKSIISPECACIDFFPFASLLMLRSKYGLVVGGMITPFDVSSSLLPVPLHGFESVSYGFVLSCPFPAPTPL